MSAALGEIFGAILLIDALVGSLCLLIFLVRRVFCRWPAVTLRLDAEDTRVVEGGQSLLSVVRGEGFLLPGSCGGRGTCGICRVHVRRGGGDPAPAEGILVSPADRRSGVRLACQVRVRTDIEADLPEDARAAKVIRASLTACERRALDIYRLLLTVVEPPSWGFAAGQYIQIFREPPNPGDEPLTRAYSIASDPACPDQLELHVRHVSGGEMSPWLCARKPGDQLWFSGPYGSMTLPPVGPGIQIVCVAGGVGFAPMKSIVMHISKLPVPPKTWLFVGAAVPDALYDHAWAVEAAAAYPWLVYVPCIQSLSDGIAAKNGEHGSQFEQGLVTEALDRRFPAGTKAVALLCGPERMVAAARLILASKGLHPADLHADAF